MSRPLNEQLLSITRLGRSFTDSVDDAIVNPLHDGADPWVTRLGDTYYYCNATRDGRIEVWRSNSPLTREDPATVWTPPAHGWNSRQVWAPELHHIAGRWYIYYSASDGRNANHRMGVLRATSDDPQGTYEDLGQLYTGDDVTSRTNNRWAIDGTVLQLRGQLYFIWSGWQDDRDVQHLYIAEMSDPATISSSRMQLCANNCHAWEHVGEDRGERGLHEGPAILRRHGRVFLIYSASGSWQHTYKLGMLWMDSDADPMDPASWTKHDQPVFESTDEVFGVGHCSFTTTPDGQDVMLYHAKKSRRDGWDRRVHAQLFDWDEDGLPAFGQPIMPGQPIRPPTRTTPQRRAA
jgi:GH43 family beta-xylosidase